MDSKDFNFVGMTLSNIMEEAENNGDSPLRVMEKMHSVQGLVMALTAGSWRNRSVFFSYVRLGDRHYPALVYRVPDPLEQVNPKDCCEIFPSLDAMFWFLIGARLSD